MKKSIIRKILLALLIVASAGSYIYLNTLPSPSEPAAEAVQETFERENAVELENHEIILPDVYLLERILDMGKRIMPAPAF